MTPIRPTDTRPFYGGIAVAVEDHPEEGYIARWKRGATRFSVWVLPVMVSRNFRSPWGGVERRVVEDRRATAELIRSHVCNPHGVGDASNG